MPHLRPLPRRVFAAGLLGAMLTFTLGPPGSAGPAGPATARAESDDAEKRLAALASDAYRQRQEQTHALLADTSLTMEDLADLITRAETPEQRHRLLAVARHHVLRHRREQLFDRPDRGSLGISHRTLTADDLPAVPPTPGVPPMPGAPPAPGAARERGAAIEIVVTLPGFPAHAQLEPGDHVVAIDDQPLPADFTAEHFRELIMNYRSGDTIKMTLHRRGEQVSQTIELVPAQALTAMYDPGRLQLRPQFENEWMAVQKTLLADVAQPAPLQLPVGEGEPANPE